jgi:O-antigen/teichoic acid export membrane protein
MSNAPDPEPALADDQPKEPKEPATAVEPKAQRGGLGRMAMKSSAYEILSYAASQGIRLTSNLLLTRLLFPEAFGLSAMSAIFNQGLVMLSDVGIVPGVVQSPRGDDPEFLNTAWTMHVVRGASLCALAVVLAWPVAWLYDEPQLGPLLAVGSLNVLISGFDSTSLITLLRRFDSRRLMVIDIVCQLVSLAVMVVGAYLYHSVWALVAGMLVGSAVRTLISHFVVDVGYRNRFRWSKDARDAILRFGKWIFLSSMVMFFAQQIDRLFLGKFLGLAELGVYSVAITLADMASSVVARLTNQILFPVFSRVNRETPDRLQAVYYRARLAMDSLALPTAGVLYAVAPWVIALLYDDRYEGAGWMLQILVLRVTSACISTPCEICLLAMGYPQVGFQRSVAKMAWMLVSLPLGFYYFGVHGLVWAAALSEMPALVVLIPAFAKKGKLRVSRELLVPVLFGVGVVLGSALLKVLP